MKYHKLQRSAIKILGLTCSSSACERNWSTFNQVHTKKRNRLTTKNMNDLVYILYNKKLKDRHLKLQEVTEDPLVLDDIALDDEWVANPPNPNDIGDEIETSILDQEEHNVIGASQGLKGGSGGGASGGGNGGASGGSGGDGGGGGASSAGVSRARASGGASKRKMRKDKEIRPMKKSKEEEEFQDASSDDLDELDGLPIRFEDDSLDDEASDEDDIMDDDDY
ncbi:heavy metal-associated isoprenylated plant protein 32-like [Tripterygium wilfordii]|uniref:heavy metal-associated isoprenylated plant protein 32-like n=1 Tax=Tripterygium wilfordii TaxID=458696 RepID=UPI0018F80606|nr:heavy metal-associated isoprenylated plant protein 32-like [Tripterygium wilfordii]